MDAAVTPLLALLNVSTLCLMLAVGSVLALSLVNWSKFVVWLLPRSSGAALASVTRGQGHATTTDLLIVLGGILVYILVVIITAAIARRCWVILPGLPILPVLLPVAVVHTQVWSSVVVLGGAAFLARVCYLAALRQAAVYADRIRVAFDLYRHDILKQMHIPVPKDVVTERLLWDNLKIWLYYPLIPPWEQQPERWPPSPPDAKETFYYEQGAADAKIEDIAKEP